MTLKQAAAYLRISKGASVECDQRQGGRRASLAPCASRAPHFDQARTGGGMARQGWTVVAPAMVVSVSCQESTPSTERGKQMCRKRFLKSSLQDRKHGRHRVWVACWWENGSRRSKVLGRCSQLGKGEAEAILSVILQPINSGVTQLAKPIYTFERFTKEVYLPFCRRSWKESTAGTSEQIVKTHLLSAFGPSLPPQSGERRCRISSTGTRWSCLPARWPTCDGS